MTVQPANATYPDGNRGGLRLPGWRWDALRTTLWVVPVILIVVAGLLFVFTFEIDLAAFHHRLTLPTWVRTGSADAGRQVLIAIAAAIITTVGVVFSITILALTLASQQFGPRMMRNFIRDLGNQVTLGYSSPPSSTPCWLWARSPGYLAVISFLISRSRLPRQCSSSTWLFSFYFIHHIAKSIQLPQVIASIAADLDRAIEAEFPQRRNAQGDVEVESSVLPAEVLANLSRGAEVTATQSGYLQFVGFGELIAIAETLDAVISLEYGPGHFVVANSPLATVWPAGAAGQVAAALKKAHVTGPHRTLTQDPVFAIDQLVEIAIRALSPAVNDTFTALTCIDWISAGLSEISGRALAKGVYRGPSGKIRLVEYDPSYERMVNRAFDKIRQAARGMPAVLIRLIDAVLVIDNNTKTESQRAILLRQAEMVMRVAEETVPEANDLADVRERFVQLLESSETRNGLASFSGD